MNERWKKEILNLLLDKYERTAAYHKGDQPDRRVILRFYDSGKVYFFGNIKNHPDYDKIKEFIKYNNSIIEIICQDMPITDIGGAVIIK